MIKKVYGTPKKVPGIGNSKGISIYGKPSHDVTSGKISDLKINTLKGDPWKTPNGAIKKILGK